jgi:hypothetical protein
MELDKQELQKALDRANEATQTAGTDIASLQRAVKLLAESNRLLLQELMGGRRPPVSMKRTQY